MNAPTAAHGLCDCEALPYRHILGIVGCTLSPPDPAPVLVTALANASRAEKRAEIAYDQARLLTLRARLALAEATARDEHGFPVNVENERRAVAEWEEFVAGGIPKRWRECSAAKVAPVAP